MKRIIGSSVMMVAVLAIVVAGTGAFFTATETSQGNVFTAGNIDLLINHTAQSYNGVECQTCQLSLVSSTSTQVVAQNDEASFTGTLPSNAVLVSSIPGPWVSASQIGGGAQWIWVTDPALPGDTGGSPEYTFEETFTFQGSSMSFDNFSFAFAADNGYRVELNGELIVDDIAGSTNFNSPINLNSSQQEAFEDALQLGVNVLHITVRNLDPNNPNLENPNNNPAGLIYNLTFLDADCEAGVADFQQTCQLWESTDLTNETFFNFSDIKPQDEGTNLISMTVESNESYLCLAFNNIDEIDADENSGEGSMGDYMRVAGWVADADGNATGDALFGPDTLENVSPMTYADSSDTPVTPGETQYMLLAWCYGDMEVTGPGTYTCDGAVTNINDTQGEQLVTDLQFFAIQSRNNSDFTCADADFGDDQ